MELYLHFSHTALQSIVLNKNYALSTENAAVLIFGVSKFRDYPFFILLFRPFVTRSDESGWDHWICDSAPPSPHSSAIAQITLSSVNLCLSINGVDSFRASCNVTPSSTWCILCFQKVFVFIKIHFEVFCDFLVILCVYYWHYTSSWNRRGFLYWKCISTFVTVLAVQFIKNNRDSLSVWKNSGHIPDEFEAEADKPGTKTGTFASGFSGIRHCFQITVQITYEPVI